jgi:hypothetical protein
MVSPPGAVDIGRAAGCCGCQFRSGSPCFSRRRRWRDAAHRAAQGRAQGPRAPHARAYEKGRAYYAEIIEAVEQNRYGWEVDQNYLPFQRRRLEVVERILASRRGGR